MGETRGGKYGRNLAYLVLFVLNKLPSSCAERARYKEELLKELHKYSFEPRKKGRPINRGCIYELNRIERVEITKARDFGRLLKEGLHLMYQKQTSRRAFKALIYELDRQV